MGERDVGQQEWRSGLKNGFLTLHAKFKHPLLYYPAELGTGLGQRQQAERKAAEFDPSDGLRCIPRHNRVAIDPHRKRLGDRHAQQQIFRTLPDLHPTRQNFQFIATQGKLEVTLCRDRRAGQPGSEHPGRSGRVGAFDRNLGERPGLSRQLAGKIQRITCGSGDPQREDWRLHPAVHHDRLAVHDNPGLGEDGLAGLRQVKPVHFDAALDGCRRGGAGSPREINLPGDHPT